MAEVTSGRNLTVLVMDERETEELTTLIQNLVEHYEGNTELASIAMALGVM